MAYPLTNLIPLEKILGLMDLTGGAMASKNVLSVSKEEFDSALAYIEGRKDELPVGTYNAIKKVFYLYTHILETFEKSKSILGRLREAMRIVPRTEKGSSALGKFQWWKTAK